MRQTVLVNSHLLKHTDKLTCKQRDIWLPSTEREPDHPVIRNLKQHACLLNNTTTKAVDEDEKTKWWQFKKRREQKEEAKEMATNKAKTK